MAAFFVDVEFGGDSCFVEGGVEFDGVLGVDGFVFGGVENEAGWGVGGDVIFGGHFLDYFLGGFVSEEVASGAFVCVGIGHGDDGVAEDGEVGAGACALNWVGGFTFTFVVLGGGGGGEVASGGESDDADLVGIDVPFCCTCTDGADGALCVENGGGVMVIGCDSVLEDEGGDAVVIAPFGDLFSFVIVGEVSVASSGRDYDCSAVWAFR